MIITDVPMSELLNSHDSAYGWRNSTRTGICWARTIRIDKGKARWYCQCLRSSSMNLSNTMPAACLQRAFWTSWPLSHQCVGTSTPAKRKDRFYLLPNDIDHHSSIEIMTTDNIGMLPKISNSIWRGLWIVISVILTSQELVYSSINNFTKALNFKKCLLPIIQKFWAQECHQCSIASGIVYKYWSWLICNIFCDTS